LDRERLIDELRNSGVAALAAMSAVPADRLAAPGYENGWTVQQVMAHVASMEFTYRRLPDLARGSRDAHTTTGGPFDMDGYNARQVARRAGATPAQLIEEFINGRAALIAEVEALDDALLDTPVRSAGGNSGSLADVLMRTAAQHASGHAADFARAAAAEPSTAELAAAAVLLSAEEAAIRVGSVPPEVWLRRRTEQDWPAAGVTGHLIELMPYWTAKCAEAASRPETKVGREINAPERLGGVVAAEQMTPAEAAAALRTSGARAAARLRGIPAERWQNTVKTLQWGDIKLADCVDRLLVQHAREHLRQLSAALATRGT
jgi:hypothetical protein